MEQVSRSKSTVSSAMYPGLNSGLTNSFFPNKTRRNNPCRLSGNARTLNLSIKSVDKKGPQMSWIQNNLDWVFFAFGCICAVGGYLIGHNIGVEQGMDSGFHAGKDLADRAWKRQKWTHIGDGYSMSKIDGTIVREIKDGPR